MKKLIRFTFFALVLLSLFISCGGKDNGHDCVYDSVTHACSICNKIEKGIISYVKNPDGDIVARFFNLQDAADFIKNNPSSVRDISAVTVYGVNKATFYCDGISIEDGQNIAFDLSTNTVTFKNNAGISVSNSTVSFNVKTVKGNGIPITVDGGSLDLNSNSSTDYSYKIDLNGSSTIALSGSEIQISDFSCEKDNAVTIKSGSKVSLLKPENNVEFGNSLSEGSSGTFELKNHTTHNYDSISQYCVCGELNSAAVLFVGASFEKADARFVNLQTAANYVHTIQSQSSYTNPITVYGVKDATIPCNTSNNEVNLQDCNIIFDLSESSVASVVDFKLSSSDVELGWVNNLTCTFALSSSSSLVVNSGNVLINGFSSDSNSEVSFKTGKVVRANTAAVAKSLRPRLSNDNTSSIDVDVHSHSYVSKKSESYNWDECSSCGFCTEKVPDGSKWVSFFYLDMSNLDSLTDLEEIVELVGNPTNVTIYIITGGGKNVDGYTENSLYYNPFYNDSKQYPYLAQAITNAGGDKTVSFYKSSSSNQYQYWIYYSDGTKGCFKEITFPLTRKMSDGSVLEDFINKVYNEEKSPKTRYFLHLWNHGGGNLLGMMQDFTDNKYKPLMTMKDFDDSIKRTNFYNDGKKFDMVLFDMCLMQEIETLNIIKQYAKCLIGSENTSVASALGSIYQYMNEHPCASYQSISTYFIEKTDEKQTYSLLNKYRYSSRTWSSIDLLYSDKIDRLNEAFNSFLGTVVKYSKDKITSALNSSVNYDDSYDICSFASSFNYDNKSELSASLNNILICNKCGYSKKGSTGLAFDFYTNIENLVLNYGYGQVFKEYIDRAKPLYPNLVTLYSLYYNDESLIL